MDNHVELALSLLIITSPIVIATHLCKQGGGSLQPDENKCHIFYDCSQTPPDNSVAWLSEVAHECQYPQLFNSETRTCEPDVDVKCGSRYEPKSACEYTAYLCTDPFCQPCRNDFPECTDHVAEDTSGAFFDFPRTKCGYTKYMQLLTCPRDEDGKRIPLDASVCKDAKMFLDGVII